jgi:hypothetical protein
LSFTSNDDPAILGGAHNSLRESDRSRQDISLRNLITCLALNILISFSHRQTETASDIQQHMPGIQPDLGNNIRRTDFLTFSHHNPT